MEVVLHWFFKSFILSSFLLVGCTQLDTTKSPVSESFVLPDISEPALERVEASKRIEPVLKSMDSQTMFEILVAEMLVQKNRAVEAYSLMMPLAHKTQDIGLSQRAFELSLHTRDFTKMKEAADLLKSLLPSDPVAWRASYLLSVLEGDIPQAVEQWQTYLKLSQESFEQVFLTTVNRLSRSVSPEHGLAFLQEIKRLYPNERAVNYGIGTAALIYKDYTLAKKHLHLALSNYKNNQNELVYKGIHLKLIEVYLKLEKFSEGIDSLASYVKENPANVVLQELYARLEVKAGRLVEAEKRYENILKISPGSYGARLSLALLQLERKSYLKAEENLTILLEHPRYKNYAAYYLGFSKKEQGYKQKAISYFKQVKKGLFFIDAQIQIAEINYLKLGLEATIQNLAALQPEEVEDKIKLLIVKAIFHRSSTQIEKAIEFYDKAIQLDPENVELLFSQSILFYETSRYDEYEAILKKILSIDPKQVDALNALGYFYVEKGKHLDKAEDLINQALAISPHSFYILDSKGWLRFAQGRYLEAKDFFIKALEIKLDKVVIIHLIKTKWMLEKHEEAKKLWQEHKDTYLKNTQFEDLINTLTP